MNTAKRACCCATGSFLQEERHHHAKRNERHESKAFTAAAFLDFVIDQRKQYAGEESERKTDQSS